nr:unnamed protein product [Spirometra erinaceieuropaei]
MLKTDDGVELYKDDEKAEHLSRFFQSVFTREVAVPTDHCNVDNVPTIDSVVLTKPIVQQELLKLKEGTSPGPDEIPAKLLKELAKELAEPLSVLFQASLDAGRLPPDWKTAWISPIHKNGSRASANNYRPVSLTSICCKVMERIIKRELMRFLEQNHLLCDAQHGFRRGRSCLSNLLYCLEQWTRAIDEGNVVHVAYIDFKKAFDSVPHQRLLHKLSRIGVRGKLLKWIENFLVGRSQTVRLGGQHSAEVTVTSGVPQGSVLGPILFLIYIDDCIHGLDCKIAMFADDIKLWTVIRNEDDEANLQANLDRLEKWSGHWLLPFNVTKCNILRIGRTSSAHRRTYYLNHTPLPLLQLPQYGTDAEDSGQLQNSPVRDPVLPSQPQYSAGTAEKGAVEHPVMAGVDGLDLRSVQKRRLEEGLAPLQFEIQLKVVAIPQRGSHSAEGLTGLGDMMSKSVVNSAQ